MTDTVTPTQPDQGKQPTQQAEERAPIPYSRFAEVNEAKRKAEERIAQLEAAQKAEVEKTLAEQQQFKELAEKRGKELAEVSAKAAKVEVYEQTLTAVLADQIASLPEKARELVPDELTVPQKLAWIAKHGATLRAPAPIDIGAGRQGGSGQRRNDATPEDVAWAAKFGYTVDEYLKNKG